MITVTMPEWFTWFLVILSTLGFANVVAGMYLQYLSYRLKKLKNNDK